MSRRSSASLKKKAITAISLILIVGLTVNTVVLTAVASGKYKSAILSKSSAIGENLQRELGKVLGLGVPIDGLEGADEKLREITLRNPAIGYSMVIDPNGRVVYHSEESQRGKQLNDNATQRAAAAEETLVQPAGAYYDIALPLRNAENGLAGALRVGVKAQAINTQVYVLLLWAVGIAVVCFLLSMALVSAFVMRVVLRPINEMKDAAERMAAGDLTSAVDVKGDDEIAALQRSINRIGMNLKDMIGKVTRITNSVAGVTTHVVSSSQGVLDVADTQKKVVDDTAEAIASMDGSLAQVSSNVEQLSEAAANTSSSIYEMSASIGKIAENAGIFSETANETASSVEEMVSTIKQIAQSLENLSTSSEAIASSIDEVNATTRHIEERANESVDLTGKVMENASVKGSGAAHLAVQGMEEIRNTVASLSDMINGLGRKTGDIGKIINVIDDVADQTNLLAINAAILASKAGEHGKGFTVVADEIKSLAERTSFSTSEVAALIRSVQDMTRSSMTMAGNAIHTVEKGLSMVRDVGGALSEIVESAKASSEMAKAIQRATAEEALAVKQITDAVEGMTVQTETISRAIQEQSKGSRFIVDATERVKNLSLQVRTATSEQKDGSRQMSGIVEQMTSQTMQIADAVSRQKEKSRELIGAIERIRGSAGKLITAANAMNAAIGSLKTESENLMSELKQFRT